MNLLNNVLLQAQIHAWKYQEVCGDIDVNTDPLANLKDTSDNGVGKYMRQIIRNFYSVLETLFVTGIAVTILGVLIKIALSKEGKGRNEGKSDLLFKVLLVVVFFALIPIVNTLIAAVKQILS